MPMAMSEDYLRLASRDRRVELTAGLSGEEISAVEASEMAPGFEHLNIELTTGKDAAR